MPEPDSKKRLPVSDNPCGRFCLRPMAASTALAPLWILIASYSQARTPVDECILQKVQTGDAAMTIGEIRQACQQNQPTETDRKSVDASESLPGPSAVEQRFASESEVEKRPFAITPHKPNYVLLTYSESPNQDIYDGTTGASRSLDNTEVKFQVSIKAPLWRNILGSNIDAYFAYTAQSWWQMFNNGLSSPFRETKYEPEIFLRNFTNYNLFGIKLAGWSLGVNHQSNGRSEPLSRSWNRLLARFGLEVDEDLTFLVRAWYRIEEDEEDDDNPNMHHFYGYGDIRAIWTPNRNTYTLMLRPGTEHFSYELTWSYPIGENFRVYAQYYDGVGESLIDYDYENKVFGIGFSLNDYLMHK